MLLETDRSKRLLYSLALNSSKQKNSMVWRKRLMGGKYDGHRRRKPFDSFLPGFHDKIALTCLAWVCQNTRFNSMRSSGYHNELRKKMGIIEHWVYFNCPLWNLNESSTGTITWVSFQFMQFMNIYSMPEVPLTHSRYIYIHDDKKRSPQTIDSHHILIRKSNARNVLLCLVALLFFTNICYLLLVKKKPGIGFLWSTLFFAFIIRSLHRWSIKKESVMILPTLGVQLEAHYWSGTIVHRFVPMGKILKPVINECVTPVTCYWSLALIARDEADLILVFKELRPPLSMLVPVWKALCDAIDVQTTNTEEVDN